MAAVKEQRVISPLQQAQVTKAEIRELSKELGLATWTKQSFACLFPYGERITPERFSMIDHAKQHLLDLGLHQVHVRHYGNHARIETDEDGFTKLMSRKCKESIHAVFKAIGFTYVSLIC